MAIFFLLTLLLLVLLVFRQRFDVRFVFCFSLMLYALPLYFGCVATPGYIHCQIIEKEVYYIYSIVFSFSSIYLLLPSRVSEKDKMSFSFEGKEQFVNFLFFLVVFFLLFFLVKNGNPLSYMNKRSFMDNLGFEWLLYKSLLIVYSVYVLARKAAFFHKAIASLLIVFTTVIGARDVLVLSSISVLLIRWGEKRWTLPSMVAIVTLSSLSVVIVSIIKPLYAAVRSGYVSYNGLYDFISRGGEFLTRASVVNEVVRHDFIYPLASYLKSFYSVLPIPVSFFGVSSGEFNRQMQSVLFSDMEGGIAYSPWAEAYSVGGYVGVALFSFLFIAFLYFLEKWANKKILVAVVASYAAFYIERNSLGTTLGYIRNIVYPVGMSYLAYYIFIRANVIVRRERNV